MDKKIIDIENKIACGKGDLGEMIKKVTIGPYDLELVKYGFKLSKYAPEDPLENYSYKINLGGEEFIIDDHCFLRIGSSHKKTVYLATSHNAAYLFMLEAYKQKKLNGRENFFHIDSATHPDNGWVFFDICPSKAESLSRHLRFFNTLFPVIDRRQQIEKRFPVTVANYITALSRIFPDLRLNFLHEKKNFTKNCFSADLNKKYIADYGGGHFQNTEWLFKYPELKGQENIASIDLDLFARLSAVLRERRFIRQLQEIVGGSKIAMLFLSPTYIKNKKASKAAEKILNSLF